MKSELKFIDLKVVYSILFAVLAALFWHYYYPGHILYQEQFQMFLADYGYLVEYAVLPGGLAKYIGSFLTQFYLHIMAGVVIIVAMLLLVQLLMWSIMKKAGSDESYYFLSFLPTVATWMAMCDESLLTAFPVSLIITLAFIRLSQIVKYDSNWSFVFMFVVLPVLYWIVGGIFVIYTLWMIFILLIKLRDRITSMVAWALSFLVAIYTITLPIITCLFVYHPLTNLINGLFYYRFPGVRSFGIILTEVVTVTVLFVSYLKITHKPIPIVYKIVSAVLLVAFSFVGVNRFSDADAEEMMRYDALVARGSWYNIIGMAEKKNPTSPMSVTCLNLALAKTGQLADRMFEFYQNGTEGLIPEFKRDFNLPLVTSEVFYHLGMINIAQRYAFEAMEAIPDYQKSSRIFKRLAETAMINGDKDVARKYLRLLSKTMFYGDWAKLMEKCLDGDTDNDLWRDIERKRNIMYDTDFLFSELDMPAMLGRLFVCNESNKMAYEYLMAYVLQKNDLKSFVKFYPLGKELGYKYIPKSYQEALLLYRVNNNQGLDNLPWSISQGILNNMKEFMKAYSNKTHTTDMMKVSFGSTYWYYFITHNIDYEN